MDLPWLSAAEWYCYAVATAILIAAVSYATIRSGRLLRTWVPDRNLMLSVPDNVARLSILFIGWLVGHFLGPGSEQLGWQMDDLARDLVVGTAAGLLLATVLNLAGTVAVRRWGSEIHSTRLIRCILPINRREWIGVVLMLLPAAALEELIFRSLPLGGLRSGITLAGVSTAGRALPGLLADPWLLLWPLALLFGLAHWSQGAWGVAGATVAAVVFSWLFLATGSIWTPLAAHYAMNVHQLVLAKRSGLSPLRLPSCSKA